MSYVKHIALFQFRPDCTADDQALVWCTLQDLVRKIPGIIEFSHGPDISTEGLSQGFTHSFIFTFESVAARNQYLPHPDHQEAVRIVLPKLERIIVIDHTS